MLLRPSTPITTVDEGERPCLVGTGPGIKLLGSSPSGPTELRSAVFVVPAKAGIQGGQVLHVALDPRLRGGDD
jgi:hypothetical protein